MRHNKDLRTRQTRIDPLKSSLSALYIHWGRGLAVSENQRTAKIRQIEALEGMLVLKLRSAGAKPQTYSCLDEIQRGVMVACLLERYGVLWRSKSLDSCIYLSMSHIPLIST